MDDVHAGRWQRILNSLMLRLASPLRRLRNTSGQSMVEYSLIAVLVALAIGTTIVLTKGAIGNVFSNTVYNLVGQTQTPYTPPNAAQLNAYASAFAQYQATSAGYKTNTPLAPTCAGAPGSWAVTNIAPNNGTFVAC